MVLFEEKLDNFLVRYLAYFNYRNYVSKIDLKGNETILEVGSGGGNLSIFLAKKLPFGKLVCVENSNYWIDKARNRLKDLQNIEFVVEDILNFEKKNYFDTIVVHYIFHDLFNKEKTIGIFRDSLKQNGYVYVREPTRESHGISSRKIEYLFKKNEFLKVKSKENYLFPLKGKIYEGIFLKQ